MTALSLAAVLALLPACSRENDHKEDGHEGHDHGREKHESSDKAKQHEKKTDSN